MRRIPKVLALRQQQRAASTGMRELERVQAQVFRAVVAVPAGREDDSAYVTVRIPRALFDRARTIAALFHL